MSDVGGAESACVLIVQHCVCLYSCAKLAVDESVSSGPVSVCGECVCSSSLTVCTAVLCVCARVCVV